MGLSSVYVNKTRREVANIVRCNAKANAIELNKQVMSIIQMDEDFKGKLMSALI